MWIFVTDSASNAAYARLWIVALMHWNKEVLLGIPKNTELQHQFETVTKKRTSSTL